MTVQAHAIYRELTGRDCEADVYLSPRMGTRTAGLYRQVEGRHQIVLSQRYLGVCSRAQAEDLIRHELAHYHLATQGHPRAAHGPLFRTLMLAWKFSRFPDRDLMAQIADAQTRLRHLYVCPRGHEHWLLRHPRRRAVSCAVCSPVYDQRFRLRYSGVSRRGKDPAV